MNCESAREYLSSYYDRELDPDRAAAVRAHLEQCSTCTHQLEEFEELSKLAVDLREPVVPARVWPAIEASLAVGEQPKAGRNWKVSIGRVAASVALASALALFAYETWQAFDPHTQMAIVFDGYLAEFKDRPEQAQQVLRARYNGQPISLKSSARDQFTPNAPTTLPGGFTRVETFVLDMPCCTCTQTIYRNQAGDTMALFEHSEEQRMWFGSRPMIEAQCHGQPTVVVQLQIQLAATWKCGPRYLTVIGARDVEQVTDLVAFLDLQRAKPQG